MRRSIKNRFVTPVLIAALGSTLAGRVTAQTFTTLYSFTALSNSINSDGAYPLAGLIQWGDTLYGTTLQGGTWGNGTVFAVNTDGTGFTNLHIFSANSNPFGTNSDGIGPQAGLILSNNTLYGTAAHGGGFADGTVFKVNTDGTSFTNLYSFTATSGPYPPTNSDGGWPKGGLILSSNTLYGTASLGGSKGNGVVFALHTDGTGFTNLHSCSGSSGGHPAAGLILSNNTLYGTAATGGSLGIGTVFALNTNGTSFTNLHSFSFGGEPLAGLILSGNTLYGTAHSYGNLNNGIVFAVNTDSTGFTNLHSFTGGDGANPQAGLVLSGNTLFGTAYRGGSSGSGTVFAINTDGTGFTNVYDFTALLFNTNSDGANPAAGLILSDNGFYGTTQHGGSSGSGTVFRLSFVPQLTIVPSGTDVVLTWPTNFVGFDYTGYALQSTTNLDASAIWTTNSPAPVVINGQNTVTNPISGTQQFFRLSQ